jgi:hypothetical protein
MENKIRKILDDLYMIDDELRNNEKELKVIIEKLLKSKPEVEINEQFIEELKVKILEQVDEINSQSRESRKVFRISIKDFSFMLSGAAICAVLFVSTNFVDNNNLSNEKTNESKSQIQKLKDGAFGSFSNNRETEELDGQASLARETVSDSSVEPMLGIGAGGARSESAVSSKMILPPTAYNYVYNGEDIVLPSGKMAVYKREKNNDLSNSIINKLKLVDFSSINIKSLKNTKVSNISMVEDKEFGYNFNFDINNAMLSAYVNWEQWPNINDVCGDDEDCFEYNRLQISDIPEDKELISIANQFFSDYGVSNKDLGDPFVNKDWLNRQIFSESNNKYIPERISIVYPLKIDNKNIYNEHGGIEGVVVEVDIRFGKVAGIRNVFEHNYSSSDYAVSTDTDKILKVMNRGGNNVYYPGSESEKIDVEVGKPSISLVKIWKNEFQKDRRVELYVPCLVFPIIGEAGDRYFNKENVVVPIIEELINDFDDRREGNEIIPMPMLRMDSDMDE